MRTLWIKANKLLPPRSGGDIRSFHLARFLASRHELTFFSYYQGAADSEYERALQEEFPGAVCLATGQYESSRMKRGVDYLRRLPGDVPYAVGRFACPAVQQQLAHWYLGQHFDVAVCDFLDAAINVPQKLSIPTVLFQHNVESEIWRRHGETEPNPLKRQMYRVESWKMLRYEAAMVCNFAHIIAVSDHDRKLMSGWVDSSRITVVSTGVDLQQFGPASSPPMRGLVVFVGAMDWEPNIDAVEYFCDQVWPKVRKDVPSARFRIVGRNPARRVQKLTSDSIEVTGSVPSVQRHLQEAAVVVVPLRIGGGTRLKIYEAMAMGKAVVSTSVGAEGLDVHDGRDIVLADQPAAFARAVKILLQDDELRARYGRAATVLAQLYDWPEISKKFAEVLEGIAGMKGKLAEADTPRMPETVPFGDGEGRC